MSNADTKYGGSSSGPGAIYRKTKVEVTWVAWDWDSNQPKDPKDITIMALSFQWLKSIKNPASRCVLTMLPQFSDSNYLDLMNPMDVIQIYEFDTLKFQGYITRIGASGEILPDGTPSRRVSLYISSFGELISNANLGVSLFLQSGWNSVPGGTYVKVGVQIAQFVASLATVMNNNQPYSSALISVIDEWLNFVSEVGAPSFVTYFNYWINYQTGMVGQAIYNTPSDPYLFSPQDNNINLLQIIYKYTQMPFNELFMDCGPRKIYSETDPLLSNVVSTDLVNNYDYLINRATLFDGTINDYGTTCNLWSKLIDKVVPSSYIKRFDLNKTMEESYSLYLVAPAIFNPEDFALIAMGTPVIDPVALNKYLLRELHQNLFYKSNMPYPRYQDLQLLNDSTPITIIQESKYKAQTLMNWFQYNDQFLSGVVRIEVPSDETIDPRIGEKISFDNINDAYFYVEGVSHTWTYGGEITSDLTLTRGFGINGPISLKDKIFKRGIFALGNGFS
jgi:hypothetical protein